jgi:hypothetical protein
MAIGSRTPISLMIDGVQNAIVALPLTVLRFLPDRPTEARWLSKPVAAAMEARVAEEGRRRSP